MNGAFDITRLFVGDLASHCDEANIEALFKQHGIDVVNVKLMRGKNSLASLNYGFVQVSRREDAEKAIAELDSMLFLGRNIKVKHATQNHGAKQNRSTLTQSTNSIFVKFRALEVTIFFPIFIYTFITHSLMKIGIYVTEETLRNLFSSFGDVTDVSIKASNIVSIYMIYINLLANPVLFYMRALTAAGVAKGPRIGLRICPFLQQRRGYQYVFQSHGCISR